MFDGTFGGGNHTVPLLQEHKQLRALGTDLDEAVMDQCKLEYADMIKSKRLALVHSNYVNIPAIDLKEAFKRKITGRSLFDIGLLDLGMSSYQLDDEQRGFNFRHYCNDSSLDMRFDTSPNPNFASASDIVNSAS
jgi:16S rRNA (cytosine1402-N4)-methyltransferase